LTRGGDVGNVFFEEEGAPNETKASPLAGRSHFSANPLGVAQIAEGDKDECAASSANFGDFPSAIPTLQNRFANQDTTPNDEGYDSKGNLPYFADEEQDDIEGYVIGHGILAGTYLAEYRDLLKYLFVDVSGDRQSLGSFATSSHMMTDGGSYTW